MALFDVFKKKAPEKKEVTRAPEKKPQEKKEEAIKIEQVSSRKRAPEQAHKVLLSPHVTEKATALTEENKYIFKVWPRANKSEVRKAVEEVYGVNVEGVNMLKAPNKERRVRGQIGHKKGYKKAIVQIKEGQKIEILPR